MYIFIVSFTKDAFIVDEKQKLENKISNIKQKIEQSENEHLQSEEEVDVIYAEELRANKYDTQKKKEIEQKIETRKENIRSKESARRAELMKQINSHQQESDSLDELWLNQIINRDNRDEFFGVANIEEYTEIKEDPYFELIQYLIANGYIDESYYDFMSYFYDNSLSLNDKKFVRSVLDEKSKGYLYELNSPALVVENLQDRYFKKRETLNVWLVKHLIDNPTEQNNLYLNNILRQIFHDRNAKFILQFRETFPDYYKIVVKLFEKYPEALDRVLYSLDMPINNRNIYIIEMLSYCSDETIEKTNSNGFLKQYIETEQSILCVNKIVIDKIRKAFYLLDIKVKVLQVESANEAFLQFIYENDFYDLSFENVCFVLKRYIGDYSDEELVHKNLSLILDRPKTGLYNYVMESFEDYIYQIVSNCNGIIMDDCTALIKVSDADFVNYSYKEQYYEKYQNKIPQLEMVPNQAEWEALLKFDVVSYTEGNVIDFYFNVSSSFNQVLCDFVNKNGSSFNYNEQIINHRYGVDASHEFYNSVIRTNELDDVKSYNIAKALGHKIENLTELDISTFRAQMFIANNLICMNEENLLYIRKKYPSVIREYVINDLSEYIALLLEDNNLYDESEMIFVLESGVSEELKKKLLKCINEPISIKDRHFPDTIVIEIIMNNFDLHDLEYLISSYEGLSGGLKECVIEIVNRHLDEVVNKNYNISAQLCLDFCERNFGLNVSMEEMLLVSIKNLDREQCIKCMKLMGKTEYVAVLRGGWKQIPITDYNIKLLGELEKKEWISTYDIDKNHSNMYRVNGRRWS